MSKRIAIIDIDGCLCEYPNPVFFSYVESCTNMLYSDLEKMKEDLGLTLYEDLKSNYRRLGLKREIKVNLDALSFLELLKKDQFEIIILTSRPNIFNVVKDTRYWLDKNSVPYDFLCFVDNKTEFILSTEEHDVIVVDDNYSGLENYANDPHVKLFHFTESDIQINKPSNYTKVSGWDEVLQSIKIIT